MTPAEFRALREALHLTQPQLGQVFGVNDRTIRNIEGADGDVPGRDALAIQRLAQQRGLID